MLKTQLEREMLDNLKDTLVGLHGTQTAEVKVYYQAIEDGCSPEDAWLVFARTTREVDVWTEMEDIDTLLESLEEKAKKIA